MTPSTTTAANISAVRRRLPASRMRQASPWAPPGARHELRHHRPDHRRPDAHLQPLQHEGDGGGQAQPQQPLHAGARRRGRTGAPGPGRRDFSPVSAPENSGKKATIAASAVIARSGWSSPAQITNSGAMATTGVTCSVTASGRIARSATGLSPATSASGQAEGRRNE